jgi:large subunit ribosomal protein L24
VSQIKLHVQEGDQVLVLSGKDVGKKGPILEILQEKKRAVVEGIHMITKHLRPNPSGEGGIVDMEGTIHLSNLKLICPKCNTPARTKRQVFEREVGNRMKKYRLRVCQKCGEIAEQN